MELENQDAKEEIIETLEIDESIEDDGTELEVLPVEASEPKPYEPNFTYKIQDEEREFDELLKGKISSKEEEDYFRDLVTKASGLDEVKAKREALQAKFDEVSHYKKDYESVMSNLEVVDSMLERKDFDKLFQALGIEEKDIINHAYQRVQFQQLTPEQKAAYNQSKERENSIYDLERQNQDYQNQINQIQQQIESQNIEARKAELNNILSSEGVSSIVKSFDEKHGPGVFFQEVAKRGYLHFSTTGEDKAPKELVDEVISLYGLSVPSVSQSIQQREKPKVIPNVGASSVTPVKKSPKSLDDLRALIGRRG